MAKLKIASRYATVPNELLNDNLIISSEIEQRLIWHSNNVKKLDFLEKLLKY